ncbi:hypothetical protein CVD28_15430 [Bacillus sp. M6-12]|uniref:PilZ domain-containing protein n=1 Tax=Bacillus sp. M6-12 TaxID=2054166 RepID=UPI000C787E4B|nr:PilZ domain-containing protein [Bacillus sp. M6-12]PLS16479.1 hypothetical protein CVD28_15430 [Bacillus sp. M6-12]
MKYKREESFRFSFPVPVPGHFFITKINGEQGVSKKGVMELLDISPKGAKFRSVLNFPLNPDLELTLSFQLNSSAINLSGSIVWQKIQTGKYLYGFSIKQTEDAQATLIKELKLYRKNQKGNQHNTFFQ